MVCTRTEKEKDTPHDQHGNNDNEDAAGAYNRAAIALRVELPSAISTAFLPTEADQERKDTRWERAAPQQNHKRALEHKRRREASEEPSR